MSTMESGSTETVPHSHHPAKRKHYSVFMKLRAVEYAEVHGNMAAQRALGVFESSIRTWRNQKDELAKLAPNRSTLRHGTSKHPELDLKLKEWVLAQHQKGVPVTTISLRFKALAFAQQLSLQFRPSTSWAQRFLRRNGMQLRKGEEGLNTIDIALPDNLTTTSMSPTSAEGIMAATHSTNDSMVDTCNGSVGKVRSNGGGSKFDLHRKFWKCERRILGTTTDFVDPPLPLCKLCGQPFEVQQAEPPAEAQPSIWDLCVCEDCTSRLRLLLHPVQDRDSRLAVLEAEVATLRGWLTRLDPGRVEASVGRSSVSKRQKQQNVLPESEEPSGRGVRQRNKSVIQSPPVKVQQVMIKPKPVSMLKKIAKTRFVGGRGKSKLTNGGPSDTRKTAFVPTIKQVAVFNCFICGLSFRSRQQLQLHVKSKHDARNHFACPSCPQQFTSQSTLQRHLKQHPSTSYQHLVTATGNPDNGNVSIADSLFQCPFCSETFVLASALQDHLHHYHPNRSSGGGRRKQCRTCGKRIANSGNLKSHESKCVVVTATATTHDDDDDHQTALHVECEVGDAKDPAEESEADDYLELADLLEQGNGISGEEEMSDDEEAPTMVAQLNRFTEPGRNGGEIMVKLEPPEEEMGVVD